MSSADATPYRCAYVRSFPIADGLSAAVLGGRAPPRLVPTEVARALDQLETFAPLDEHARRMCARFGKPEMLPSVLDTLRELASAGALVSRDDLRRHARGDTGARIATVGLVTCDRVVLLRRAIESYIENARRHDSACDYVVVDDSSDPLVRAEYRSTLRDVQRATGADVAYSGLEEKRRYAALLVAESGVPARTVDFALFGAPGCGGTYGANRNALLLHTVGDAFLSADDDTIARVVAPPGQSIGLGFGGARRADVWFFPNRRAAFDGADERDEGVVVAHEGLLGKSTADLIAEVREPSDVDLADMPLAILRGCLSDRGRVVATFMGTLGDSGTPTSRGFYLLPPGATRDRMLRTESDFRTATSSREILRAYRRRTIGVAGACMTTCFALDNRSIAPPFCPVGRCEDLLFGATVLRCLEHGYFGQVPRAIAHAPEDRGHYAPVDAGIRPSFADFVGYAIATREFVPGAGTPEQRLVALGARLVEIGGARPADLDAFVRSSFLHWLAQRVESVEAALAASGGEPAYWADELRRELDAVARNVASRYAPRDLLGADSSKEAEDAALASARQALRDLGLLFQAWPTIVDAARRLRSRGVRVAAAV